MLQSSLTTKSVELKTGESCVTDLSASEAAISRDALCRTIYGRLFTWIVARVNKALKVTTTKLLS